MVRVKDTGTGIDLDILPRLFSKFVTKSNEGSGGGGNGLGLYICKGIIKAHGGKYGLKIMRMGKVPHFLSVFH